jgi:hypothetical protein
MSETPPRQQELEDFAVYAAVAEELIAKVTKDEVAEVARLLAVNIGYHHEKYGDVPQESLPRMVRAQTLDEGTKRLLLHRMQNLPSALAEVMGVGPGGRRPGGAALTPDFPPELPS